MLKVICFFFLRWRINACQVRVANMATALHSNTGPDAGNTRRVLAHDLATPRTHRRYDH